MVYLFTLLVMILLSRVYFVVARRRGMLAGVNTRSSHQKPVVTGAGFIFAVSYFVYTLYHWWTGILPPYALLIGVFALAIVSFIDDMNELWYMIRLIVQFLAVALLMYQLKSDFEIPLTTSVSLWLAAAFILIFVVGQLNLYNFMDGLNGMLGGLTLASLIPLILINKYVEPNFVDMDLLYFTLLPTLLFQWYNYRKQPKCFCGDVGSIVLGFIMSYFNLKLIMISGNVAYVLLFAVVYIEAGFTVLQRFFAGENVFKPHRIHLFQLYCNEHEKSHLLVSLVYTSVQLFFGISLFLMNYFNVSIWIQNLSLWLVFAFFGAYYLLKKRKHLEGHLLGYDKKKFTK